jgi:VanZ family protein
VLLGPWLSGAARRAWDDPRAGGTVGKLLLGYLLLVALIQLLPLDLTVSPADVYRRVRDQAVLVPFAELWQRDGGPAPDRMQKAANWVSLVGLYLPVGMLAAHLPWGDFRRGLPAVAVLGLLLALLMEGLQLFVSRTPSTTDALFGGVGVAAGWAAVRGLSGRLTPELALVLGQVWLGLLAVVNWYPFDFGPPQGVTARLEAANWVPLADSEAKDYMAGFQELLQKATLFIPFGVLVAAVGRSPGPGRLVAAAGVGMFAAAVLEFGQVLVPSRYPSVTDVVLGAAAAVGGAAVASRVRSREAT